MTTSTEILAVLPTFLRSIVVSLGAVVGDTAHAGRGAAITSALNVAASLIERGEAGAAELQKLADQVAEMVSAGTEPTAEQWADLRARSDAAHLALQNADAPAAAGGP